MENLHVLPSIVPTRTPGWPSVFGRLPRRQPPERHGAARAWSDCDIYIGSEFRIDVSSEACSRFDQNVTGFRAEEEFGFNATPYVATGEFVKILGL
jgi:hypothetical protein